MSECKRFEPELLAYVSGNLGDSDVGPLLGHCRDCEACRRLLELHRDLSDMAAETPELDAGAADALQSSVISAIARREQRTIAASGAGLLPSPFPRGVAAVAASVLLVAVGLFAGRALFDTRDGNGQRLIHAISADAAANIELADVEDSRFTYSNVSFRKLEGGLVALDFDVATHVQLVEPAQSEMVREVLVHSLLNPSTTGARLKAISYAAGAMEPKVQQALIFAMRRDENLAVRLKALTLLSDRLSDPRVETAVLDTLRDDDSVQMRLLALEHLAAESVDRERIRALIGEPSRPGDEALLVRLGEFDRRL